METGHVRAYTYLMASSQALYRCALACLVLLGVFLGVAQAQDSDYSSDPFDPIIARDAWVLISRAEANHRIPPGLLHAISLVETGKGIRGWVLPWPYTVGVNGTGSQSFSTPQAAAQGLARWKNLGFVRFDIRAPGVARSNLTASNVITVLQGLSPVAPVVMEGRNYGRRFNSATEAESFANRMIAAGYRNIDVGMMQINWKVHGRHFANVAEALEPTQNLAYAVRYLLENRQTRDWWGSVGRYHSGTARYANRYIRNVYTMYLRIHRVKTTA